MMKKKKICSNYFTRKLRRSAFAFQISNEIVWKGKSEKSRPFTATIDVKLAKYKNKIVNAKPEYDQMREFALQSKKSLREIEREILEKINNIIEK